MNENNLWELEDNCKNACNAIATFYHKYPHTPRQIVQMQFLNLNFNLIKISHFQMLSCWYVSLLHGVGGEYGMAAELGHMDIVEYTACGG